MKTDPPDPLITAVNRLLKEIGIHADDQESLELKKLDECARVLCSQLKALTDLDARILRQSKIDDGQTYTRHEDLPPLPPEERDPFKQELIDLLAPREAKDGKSESG
jgi:predicted RNA binding protein with dsRBD fold (UPF0201 family)